MWLIAVGILSFSLWNEIIFTFRSFFHGVLFAVSASRNTFQNGEHFLSISRCARPWCWFSGSTSLYKCYLKVEYYNSRSEFFKFWLYFCEAFPFILQQQLESTACSQLYFRYEAVVMPFLVTAVTSGCHVVYLRVRRCGFKKYFTTPCLLQMSQYN